MNNAPRFRPPAPDGIALDAHVCCNYPGDGFARMTAAEWMNLPSSFKGTWLESIPSSAHRVRVAIVEGGSLLPVYLVDAARVEPEQRHA
ncbi:hypothetical protein AB4Z46_33375 [Variovorax sp. M-6]|uniref:hypothetical protein n=1 Tax=Variovorax sp. M-6 TaxID=3233041 RepID=UPI003F9E18D6